MSTKFLSTALAVPLFVMLGCSEMTLAPGAYDAEMDDDDAGDDDYAADDDTDDVGEDACDIAGTHPVDGDPTAYYRDSLQVFFAQPVTAANLSAIGPEGDIPGATELSEDGLTATFDPYGDGVNQLIPTSTYEARVEGPGCVADWTFTTSTLGSDLSDDFLQQLENHGVSYTVDLSSATLADPPGAGPLFALLDTTPFLMSLQLHDEIALDMRAGGLAVDDFDVVSQNRCIPTVEFSENGASWLTGAHVSLSPITDTPIPIQVEGTLMLQELSFDGDFVTDGTVLTMGRFDGVVNGLDLDEALQLVTGDQEAYAAGTTCGQLEQLGSPCGSCPGAPEEQNCFKFALTDLEANLLDAFMLDSIGEAELANCAR